MKADLIEIHISFPRAKNIRHVEKIADRIRESLQRDLNKRFPRQLPNVMVVDVRGDEPEEGDR